jgi:uncharacterized protein (AIM24 family)
MAEKPSSPAKKLGGAVLAAPGGVRYASRSRKRLFLFSAEGAIQDSLGQAKGRCRPTSQP